MRLLKIEDGIVLTYTKDLIDDIPPYVILSHTWLDDEDEVTYKDLIKGRGRDKIGYQKIDFCAKRAISDGFEYLWIDSCCINKSDLMELQYAINSMFSWYQNASKCYVYLTDVSMGSSAGGAWMSEFPKTRWVTRGWTLQELIAPSSVEFFASGGDRLGDKLSLESQLHDMTGIPIKALRNAPLREFDEHERMSWMKNRQTKYSEDKAYALLGIFNIQMPLIYGEGEQNAFFRLKETIELYSSRSRPTTSFPKCHTVMPVGRNDEFVGRGEIVGKLVSQIAPENNDTNCQMTVIEGLGGVGKTQIALESAYRVREKNPFCSLFWVPAVDETTIDNAYRKIGQALQIPGINDDRADIKSLVKETLSKDDIGYWLLIIDNADDMELMFSEGDEQLLYDYLPFSFKGSILLTTRNHEVTIGLDIQQDSIQPIAEMEQSEAMQLLQKRLKDSQLRDENSTNRLLDFLANLPLAIRQASAYMLRTGISTTKYLEYCETSDAKKIEILSKQFEDRSRYRYDKSANPIATTWLISFKYITKQYPLASRYLKFIGFLAEKDIPMSLLPEGEEAMQKVEAISILKHYAFINLRDDSDSFDIHRLVRLAVRNWMKHEERDRIEEVIQHLSNLYPYPSSENKHIWIRFLSHGDTALDSWTRSVRTDVGWKLLIRTGESHFILGKAQSAELRYRQASQISEKFLGPKHPDTIISIHGLSTVLRQQAKYPEAELRQRQILDSSIQIQGRTHPGTLAVMNGLAELLRQSGRYKLAEQQQRETVQLCSSALGEGHANTLVSMNNLIIVYYQNGNYAQAEKQCRDLIRKKIEIIGEDSLEVISSLNSLAIILDLQGKYEDSEKQHRQNLQLISEILGAEHPETMASVTNLASVLYRQGKYMEAEQQHRLAINAITRELSNGHPDTLANTNGLAEVLRQQGKSQPAEKMHRQTLQLITKILGSEHPSTLMVLTNLGATLLQQGDLENSERLFQESLVLKTKVFGAEHPSTLSSLSGLAHVFLARKEYAKAERHYRRVRQLRNEILGTQHPFTIASMNNLAIAQHLRKRHQETTGPDFKMVRRCVFI